MKFCILSACLCFASLACSVEKTECLQEHQDPTVNSYNQEYIRRLIQLLDLDKTLLGEYVKGIRHPEISAMNNLNVNNIMAKLQENGAAIQEMLTSKQNINQTDDPEYYECYIDYAEFIVPVTNRLMNIVRERKCQEQNIPSELCNLQYPPFPTKPMHPWGRKLIDAMAKIPEGLTEGKLHWVGGFDFCIEQEITYEYAPDNFTQPQNRSFTGQYCRLDLSFNALLNRSIDLPLQFGICVPGTCNKKNVARYITEGNVFLNTLLTEVLQATLTQVYCGQELDPDNDIPYQTAIGVILTFLLLGIIASIYDGFFRIRIINRKLKSAEDSSGEKFVQDDNIGLLRRLELALVGFSWYSNIRKIFSTTNKDDHLPVLNGLRYLTFVWIIAGNTYVFGPIYQECWVSANIISALQTLPKTFKFQAIINYHLNTDTFLVISGVLISYWFLKRVEKNNGLSIRLIVHYILHRYWRLMPGLMLTLMFYTCLNRYFADGPLFPADIGDANNCRVNWWVDLLMVHNLVRTDYLCLTWLFYVPLIFQLHVAFLVFLIPLVIRPMLGYIILGVLYCAHIAVTATLTSKYRADDDAGMLFKGYYLTPWCRAGPAIIGMVVGIILYKIKNKERDQPGYKVNLNLLLVLLGWICALGTMAAVVFSSYSQFKEGGTFWSDSANVAYDTLARSAWAVAVGWMVFACCTGHGGIIGRFLGWDLFLPLSRLVYPSLFTSAMMVFRLVYTNRILLYIDDYHMLYMIFGHLIYIVFYGIFFSLLWHYPASIGLEKAVCCKTTIEWLKAGRYPEELEENMKKQADEKKEQ